MTDAIPFVRRDDQISDGLLEKLNQKYVPSENARLALIRELADFGSEIPDLQIYPEFKLVVMTKEQELQLSWAVDSPSSHLAQLALVYSFEKVQEALGKVIRAGLLPNEGEIWPPFPICILEDYEEYPFYLCLPEELKTLRRKAIQAVNRCFKNVRDFTKPPAECYSRVIPPIGCSFEEKFQGAAGALNRAIAELPAVPDDSDDAHPDGDSLIPPSAR